MFWEIDILIHWYVSIFCDISYIWYVSIFEIVDILIYWYISGRTWYVSVYVSMTRRITRPTLSSVNGLWQIQPDKWYYYLSFLLRVDICSVSLTFADWSTMYTSLCYGLTARPSHCFTPRLLHTKLYLITGYWHWQEQTVTSLSRVESRLPLHLPKAAFHDRLRFRCHEYIEESHSWRCLYTVRDYRETLHLWPLVLHR